MAGRARTHRGAVALMTLMLVVVWVGVGVSRGPVGAVRGEDRVSAAAGSTGGLPRPVFGIHTPAVGVARPVSPDTPAETAVGGGSTAVVGQGAPLAIASQNCQPSATTASDLQNEFNIRGPVWGGGDGAEPVPIDNGRTLWLFGDTYLGGGPLNGPLDNKGFVHNSMAVQYNGSCFAYLFRGDPQTGWYSAIPEPSDTDYYWPNAAAYDPVSGVLTISAMRVHTVDPNNPWGWQLVGVDAIHYRVSPSLAILSIERLFTFGPNDRAQFGTNLLVDQGGVYLYGCAQSQPTQCFVAHTNASMQAGSLGFWSHTGWVATLAAADPIGLVSPVGTQLHVAKVGDGYIASNQIPLMGTGTWGWWGPTAVGPFSPIGQLWDANDRPYGPLHSNWFSYGGRVINTSAGAIGVFNINTSDDEGARVAGIYGPRLVTLRSHLLDRNPFGGVNGVTPLLGAGRLVGWTIDPDTTSPIQVRVTIDGTPGPILTADATTSRRRQLLPRLRPEPRLRRRHRAPHRSARRVRHRHQHRPRRHQRLAGLRCRPARPAPARRSCPSPRDGCSTRETEPAATRPRGVPTRPVRSRSPGSPRSPPTPPRWSSTSPSPTPPPPASSP